MEDESKSVWMEKYRPTSLDDVRGHSDKISSFNNYIKKNSIPNMLFSGPPGVGKTATAVSIARELYNESWESNFMELNASDERGIQVVRDDIKSFARTATGGADFRIIFLDEADSLTSDAQAALRRTMENFSSNVRFILSCNYPSQIIDPIQSRCTIYRFDRLEDSDILKQINYISESENIEIDTSVKEAIVSVSDGDMRQAIQAIRAVNAIDGEVLEEDVYSLTNSIPPERIDDILNSALDGNFLRSRKQMETSMEEFGVSPKGVIEQIYNCLWNELNLENDLCLEVSREISETDYRITQGSNSKIQIDGFLSRLSYI